MGYEVRNMEDCASNFATFEVPGSKGNTYEVTFGGESYVDCRDKATGEKCKGFQFKQDCKHIHFAYENACMYNPQYNDGKANPPLKPVEYERGPGFLSDGKCPACGGPTVVVRRAV